MKETFVKDTLNSSMMDIVLLCDQILQSYFARGFTMSLRQLYYQLIARNTFPNNEQSYRRLGEIVSRARRAGLLDWDMIVDRGREMHCPEFFAKPQDILQRAINSFKLDKWADQKNYIEVMVEKQALEGVLGPVCAKLEVPFMANKGYSSDSAMYEAGHRMRERHAIGKKRVHVIYLGDMDPSGIDMTRDVGTRLRLYSMVPVEVHRVALNIDQVHHYNLPENPAKMSDARAAAYVAEFGESSWELDALDLQVIADLVKDKVKDLRDNDRWQSSLRREEQQRESMADLVENFTAAETDTTDLD
jgi:hypothetical protein